MKKLLVAVLTSALCMAWSPLPASAIVIGVSFLDLSEQLIFSGSGDSLQIEYFINNASGVTWTDFHFRIEGAPFSDYTGPGIDTVTRSTIDVIGLNVLDGQQYATTPGVTGVLVDTFSIQGDNFLIFGQPTADQNGGTPVPMSPTLVLVTAGGLVALLGAARRRVGRA